MFKSDIEVNYEYIDEPLVILSDVSMKFLGQEVFSDIEMVVNSGDRIAIIGPNGAGKSTLLKIIIGLIEPDSGTVARYRDIRFGYLPQETHWDSLENEILKEAKTADSKIFDLINKKKEYEELIADTKRPDLKTKIAEYGAISHLYESSKGYEYERQAEETLKKFNFSEKDWKRKVKSLSGGERTRLALAKIILCRPNILILDEPTNHLDLETIEWLENFLTEWQMAIIVVSHDHQFLDKVCDKTYELNKTGIKKYFCNYSEFLIQKAENAKKQEEAFKRREKYLSQQEEFIERFRYKATKSKAVQSRIKLLDKLDKIEDPETAKKKIKVKLKDSEGLPAKVLEIEDLMIGAKDLPLLTMEGVWEVEKGDKIGIIGPNGAGKSMLLKTLVYKENALEGKIKFFGNAKIGYYAQAHEELDPDKNILDEVRSKTQVADGVIRSILGSLLFSGEDAFKLVKSLSGGERARVAIAELILNNSNMLLLDEPTNHLDLVSKDAMAEVLKDFSGPIILVSHDRYVLNKVCDIIWEIKDGEAKKYFGNYNDYKYKRDKH